MSTPTPQHTVGETKSVGGHTYRLNLSHRWELVEGPHADALNGTQQQPAAPASQPKKPAKPEDLHTAAKAQFGTVEHPHIRSIMQAMHTKGHSGQSALHDGPGQAAYDYLKANVGKQAGGGHVRDLGNGRLGISTKAGAVAIEPIQSPAAGSPKWRAAYTTQTKLVADAGGYELPQQAPPPVRFTPDAAPPAQVKPPPVASPPAWSQTPHPDATPGAAHTHTTLDAIPLSPLEEAQDEHDRTSAAHKAAAAHLDYMRYLVGHHQARGYKDAIAKAKEALAQAEHQERHTRRAHGEARKKLADAMRADKIAKKAAPENKTPPPDASQEIQLATGQAPHEQTRAEFEAAGNKAAGHKAHVKAAMAAGKQIPAHVLADYPELGGRRADSKTDSAGGNSPATPEEKPEARGQQADSLSDDDRAKLRAQGFTDADIAKMKPAGRAGFHDFKPKAAAPSDEDDVSELSLPPVEPLDDGADMSVPAQTGGGVQLPAANPPAWSNTHTPEPWQVSRGDHHRASKDLPGYDPQAVSREHKQAVSDAIDAGHDVPPEAVEDYPDLRAALAQRKNAEAAKPKPKPSDTQRPSDTPDPMGQNAIPGPRKPIAPPSGLTPEELQEHHQTAHDAAGNNLDYARYLHAHHRAAGNKAEAAKARADIAQHEYTQRHHKGELAKLKRQQKPAPQAKAPRVPTHTPQSLAANAGGFLLTHGLRDSDDNKRALAKAIASGQLDHPSKIEAVLRAAKERHQAGDVNADDKWAVQKAIDHHHNRGEAQRGAHDWKNDVRKLAEEGGHDPAALMDMVEDTHAAALEKHADREAAKKALRERAGLNSGDVDSSKYPDPASVPGFDQLAHDFAADHPDLGINPDDAEEAVWELLKEGQIPLPTRADVLDEAVQRLSSHKPMTAEERAEMEATPFAKEGSAEKYRRFLGGDVVIIPPPPTSID